MTSRQLQSLHLDPRPPTLLFSIVIPLAFHRGKWEKCLRAWCHAQTLSKVHYEVIATVPPDFPQAALDTLAVWLGPQDRLQHSRASHDIALCAEGAAVSRGKYLFFTESHCWPEPDILQKCINMFDEHADWAAFSCRSVAVTHNRLSEVEAEMYQADIDYGMNVHPWRKILDQCFVTRREAYFQSGGFEAKFGHFSEWVLAANYFALGHKVGYASDLQVLHYYTGQLAELRTFTRDFFDGEMKFFSRGARGPGGYLIEAPPEWQSRGNFDRHLALRLLKITAASLHHGITRAANGTDGMGVWRSAELTLRWLAPAIGGARLALLWAALRRLSISLQLIVCSRLGAKRRLRAIFTKYVELLCTERRLLGVATRRARTLPDAPACEQESATWESLDCAGFFRWESSHGAKFRWSEPAALVSLHCPTGRYQVRIECLPLLPLKSVTGLRFYIDERVVPSDQVFLETNAAELTIDVPRSGSARLAWTCAEFPATADRRQLGLPVTTIRWRPAAAPAQRNT